MAIYRGEDKALKITITDSAGALQDIDAMTDLIVYIYAATDHSVLQKYKKVAASGYTALLRVSATEYTAIIPHATTEIYPLRNMLVEVEIQEVDARFTDSIRRTKGKGSIAEVQSSIITE